MTAAEVRQMLLSPVVDEEQASMRMSFRKATIDLVAAALNMGLKPHQVVLALICDAVLVAHMNGIEDAALPVMLEAGRIADDGAAVVTGVSS